MFRRVVSEDWGATAAMVSFAATFLVFAIGVSWAFLLKRPKADQTSRLPLESDANAEDATSPLSCHNHE